MWKRFTKDEHIVLSWKTVIKSILSYRLWCLRLQKILSVCMCTYEYARGKMCPRKKRGQLHIHSFLLILSPSIPKIIKNEAIKSRSGERKGISPLSNQTQTQTHNLECGKYLWSRKHGSKTVDGVLRTNSPCDLRLRADEALQGRVHVSVPTRLSSCPIPGIPRCQRPHYLCHAGSSRPWQT